MSQGADLSTVLRSSGPLTFGRQARMAASLSWPAIMAQLSSILMEYIDASMVGSLGAAPAASIGLVATTTWLFWGLGGALSTGFSVQVAHLVGAGNADQARNVFRQAVVSVISLGLLLAIVGASISRPLPHWLGGNGEINQGASGYFLIVALGMPFGYMAFMASSMLRCAGNMIIPGVMNVLMCVLDVAFNFMLIFESREIAGIHVPGAGLGVMGAAIGTAMAQALTGGFLLWYILRRSPYLNFRGKKFSFGLNKQTIKRALGISAPIATERVVMCGAQILSTVIVAPLGTASIAANAFAITAESLCYMPGYGVADAATTLVGQSLGAGRKDLARSFGRITIIMGMAVMTIMGIIMWLAAPLMMSLFTPDETVRQLGAEALRIEAWAEPMFAASIVAYGVMVGAGFTVTPACINLISIWAVRLSLAALLAPVMGLKGVWLAMCIELCVRGTAFLITFSKVNWMKKANIMPAAEIEEIDNEEKPYVD
ncbi:MAG: MATE family efflux transporter [Clostridium sp.]|nr:MATE family efflux transporter [Clostridium sp.]